jgi:hypothetical protein
MGEGLPVIRRNRRKAQWNFQISGNRLLARRGGLSSANARDEPAMHRSVQSGYVLSAIAGHARTAAFCRRKSFTRDCRLIEHESVQHDLRCTPGEALFPPVLPSVLGWTWICAVLCCGARIAASRRTAKRKERVFRASLEGVKRVRASAVVVRCRVLSETPAVETKFLNRGFAAGLVSSARPKTPTLMHATRLLTKFMALS